MRIAINIFFLILTTLLLTKSTTTTTLFKEQNAFLYLKEISSFGPRTPKSNGHKETTEFISKTLTDNNWQVFYQTGIYKGIEIQNIIGYFQNLNTSNFIIGSHFDSRQYADQDPNFPSLPVMGANDGASSTAILLELARVIPNNLRSNFLLVFFDMEDNGGIGNYEWTMGSSFFVENLTEKPKGVVILDMVGDKNLEIYKEKTSDKELTNKIWSIANQLGIDEFINLSKYSMLDDHTPFLRAGIPAIDIIDFDYPYWHTTEDTIDKVSAESLGKVGDVIFTWILSNPSE